MTKKDFIKKIEKLESWQSLCLISKNANNSAFFTKKNGEIRIECYKNSILIDTLCYDSDLETIAAIYPRFKKYEDIDDTIKI